MEEVGSGSPPGQSNMPAQTPGVWPPASVNTPRGQAEQANTSGMHGNVPPEIARLRWNGGAFGLPFLWSVNHRLRWGWGILALTALVCIHGFFWGYFCMASLGVAIYLGLMGYSLGWQNRRFPGGTAQYFAMQRKWLTWGLRVIVVLFVGGLAAALAPWLNGHNVDGDIAYAAKSR